MTYETNKNMDSNQHRIFHLLKTVNSKSKPTILFQTVLFIDGIPTYYSVDKKENKFTYTPSYENLISPLPSFTIWNDGYDWLIKTLDRDFPERYIAEQAIEDLTIHLDNTQNISVNQ